MATERLALFIEANADKAIAAFRKVGGAAEGMGAKVEAAGGKGGIFSKLGGSEALAGGLVAGAAAAGTAIATFAVKSVGHYQDLVQSVIQFSRASGASMEDSSRIVAALDDMGISAETGSKAIFQLAKRIETSGDKLAEFGVKAVRGKDGNVDMAKTLLAVSDAYVKTSDPARRAALLTAAFGKQGQDLIPILARGRAGIEAMFREAEKAGQIFDPEDAERSERFRAAIDDLDDAMGKLQLRAGEVLVPFITNLADAATGVINLVDKITGAKGLFGPRTGDESELFGLSLKDLADVGAIASGPLARLGGETGKVGALAGFAADNEKDLADTIKEATSATDEQTAAANELEGALFKTVDADRALADSKRGLISANAGAADAQRDLDELMEKTAVDAEKVADAQRSLASATRSVGHAQREQTRAQEDYDEALARFNALGTDSAHDALTDASDKLADANDSVAGAQDRAKEAQEDLAKAQAGDPEFQDKLAKARQRVADANQRVADAEFNIAKQSRDSIKAHDDETTALSLKADQAGRLEDHYRTLVGLAPELAPLLNIPIATLAAAQAPGGAAAPGLGVAGSVLGSGLLGGGKLSDLAPLITPATAPKNVTVNQTFNTPVDPIQVAKNLQWAMN